MKVTLTLLLFCSLSFVIVAQTNEPPITVVKFVEPINFDGKVDEAQWFLVPAMPKMMMQPTFGNAPSERTETRLAYDENYVYLSGRNFVSKPEYTRGTTFKRDAFSGTADYFGMVMDTYNDKENGVAFYTSPTAFRWDGTVVNDGNTNETVSIDWNTFWDVKTHITDTLWTVEIRVPWSSLRFQDEDGQVKMGITSWRYIAAKNEIAIYPVIEPKWGNMSMWKASQMQEYLFEGIYAKNPLYITPYVLTGVQQNSELNTAGDDYEKINDPTIEAGLDLKYGLTNNLALDLTINTDFAQVEADDQQVN